MSLKKTSDSEQHSKEKDYVVVISHRGDWRNYPENSIPAIESVIRMGVHMMELDVKMTKVTGQVLMKSTRRSSKKAETAAEVEAPAAE